LGSKAMAGVSDGNAATSSTHVEDAIASLFSNADSMMHYTPNGEANAAASLKYRVALSLELDLDTDWALLDTLTLTNVNLRVALSKSSDESSRSSLVLTKTQTSVANQTAQQSWPFRSVHLFTSKMLLFKLPVPYRASRAGKIPILAYVSR